MKQLRSTTAVACLFLSACGGGGGGGGVVEVPFSAFSSVAPNQTVVMDATTRTSTITYTTDPSGNVTVIGATVTPQELAGTMRLTYNGSRTLSGISINSPNSNVSFSQGSSGHSVSCGGGTCLGESPTASAVIGDAFSLGWNYQTFGVWGDDIMAGTSFFGALSAGNPTPGTSLPTTPGTVVFNGVTAGFYVNPSGVPFATASTLTANVDFSNRSIGLSTSDMTLVNVNTGGTTTSSDLRINGNLSYAPGVNNFSGTVNSQNLGLTGSASGRFYGPAAEELGGTYQLTGSGIERMLGGFGAKR